MAQHSSSTWAASMKSTSNIVAVALKEQLFGNWFVPKQALSSSHLRVICQMGREASGGVGAGSLVMEGFALFLQHKRQSVSGLQC